MFFKKRSRKSRVKDAVFLLFADPTVAVRNWFIFLFLKKKKIKDPISGIKR